jgi:hypothetical protein
MFLIHIDSWNTPDPQKIIDLIPTDIRPYVVMNISLSVSHDINTGAWLRVEYGYETAKSWLRTCAANQMWAMIQPSAGGYSHFSETDLTVYREFFENYPNFLGFNYAEPFWGFDETYSTSWATRVAHWVDLMNLADTYGGYLVISWCGAYYSASMNPIAMMKRNPAFASVCSQKADHLILCEKYTSKYGFYDIESTCLGTYLSGYSGHYGIRFDQCGWTGDDGVDDGDADDTFPTPTGAAPIIEHVMLTGETVIDGPELIWQQCIRELSTGTTSDGFTTRRWDFYPQFNNISIDIFRKILDGTIRIMSRREVIDRTKLVIINDVTSGTDVDKYSSPSTLYEGLYRMDNFTDPNLLLWNRNWYKKTGRYPAIPVVYQLNGTDANSFQVKVNKSAYSTRWSTTTAKVNEFNTLFPQEYTGTIYASRHQNGWVIYNPYKTATTATGNIPFKYNTCTSIDLTLAQYTSGVIKEISNKVTFYLTNYDNTNTALKTDVIKINGCSAQPTYSYTDRVSHSASTITTSYSGGVFTLNVTHNGPLDITVNCSGTATGRLTSYTTATISSPSQPTVYTGPRQYEAEIFDYKSIAGNVTNGVGKGISNYTGLGYLQFGTNSAASVRATVKAQSSATYNLAIKYSTTGGNVTTIDLYVNGTKVATPAFAQTSTYSDWGTNNQSITLNAGTNTIELRANATGARTIYFDNIVVTASSTNVYLEAECGTVGSLFSVASSSTASNSTYATVKAGNNATTSAPADATGWISLPFSVSATGTYSVWLRTICPDYNGDSFWLKMDNGSFMSWNGIPISSTWSWNKYATTYSLTTGSHTLTIGYREDGAQLDKIFITASTTTPSGTGSAAANLCTPLLKSSLESARTDNSVKNINMYPNPVSRLLNVSLTGSPTVISLYNSGGQQLLNMNTENTTATIDMAKYVAGIYFLKISNSEQTIIERIIKE